MKKIFKICLLTVFCAFSVISCQQDEGDTISQNPQSLTKSAALTGLLQRVAMNPSLDDNVIDSTTCFSIKMPFTVSVHDDDNGVGVDYQQVVQNNSNLGQITSAIQQLTDPLDHWQLVFPLTVVYQDYHEVIVHTEQELHLLKIQCGNQNPDTSPIGCIGLNYPISIFTYDSDFQIANNYTIQNDKELYMMLYNLATDELYAIDYPFTVTSDTVSITINNNEELLAAINAAISQCNPVINPCSNPHVLTTGLIIYMPFASEARDLVSFEEAVYNGDFPPHFVADREGNPEGAVSLSGSDFDYLKILTTDANNVAVGDPLTVSLWYKMQNDNGSDLENMFEKSDGTNNASDIFSLAVYDLNKPLFYANTIPPFQLWDNTWDFPSDNADWHHLVLTVAPGTGPSTTVQLYRDGVLRATALGSGLFEGSLLYDYFLGRKFKGYLDDLRVYRKMLTPQEVTTLYNLEADINTCLN